MKVELLNDGPFTVIVDSKELMQIRLDLIKNKKTQEKQKEKEDFMMRRKTYQEPSFFNASETDWTYADITR